MQEPDHRSQPRFLVSPLRSTSAVLAAAVAVLATVLWIALVPILPEDFWWHLKFGAIIATQGLPHTNTFAWSLPAETPYRSSAWLAELLLFALHTAGGLPLVLLARTLLGLVAFGLVAHTAYRRSRSWWLAALAVACAGVIASSNVSVRPQLFAWPLCAGLAALLAALPGADPSRRRWLVGGIVLSTVLWVNLHGTFVLALLLVGAATGGASIAALWRRAPPALPQRPAPPGASRAMRSRSAAPAVAQPSLAPAIPAVAWWWGLFLLVGATTLLNPAGPSIYRDVTTITRNPAIAVLNVTEWQRPINTAPATIVYLLSLPCVLGLVWAARRSLSFGDHLTTLVFAILPWSGQRSLIWYGMIVLPIAVQALGIIVRARSPAASRAAVHGVHAATHRRILWGFVGLLALLIVAAHPPFRGQIPPLLACVPDSSTDPAMAGMVSRGTPTRATDYLRDHPRDGRLFNELGYGSYVIWALGPELPVFVDPRLELFPVPIWHDYQAISAGDLARLDQYRIERVLLDRVRQPLLAIQLANSAAWQLEYVDSETEIYRRVEPVP